MTLKPFYNEQTVKVGDETLRLVINFRAIDAIETLLGRGFDTVLDELTSDRKRLGVVGKVLWGLLREHHPDIDLDQTAGLMFGETGITVGMAVQQLLEAAFPVAEPKAEAANPPKRRGASKPS